MDPGFAAALQAFIAASGGRITITSGYRSNERQAQLFAAAVDRYGSEEAARRWVAPPGHSNHNRGVAADLGFANAAAREWAHQNAAAFGLHFPMSWEPWHIEPISARGSSSRDAYTTPPDGMNFVNPRDALDQGLDERGNVEDPYDPGIQARRLFSILSGTGEMASEAVASPGGPDTQGNAAETLTNAAAAITPTIKTVTGAQKGV
jgi:hypothetical protein